MVDFACLFQRFDPAIALAADDPAYVDWQSEVGLTDVKQQLANSVLLMTHGYSHRVITGLRGGGKTTELRRLQQLLRTRPKGQRYFVCYLDADDTLNLDDAAATDLVLAIVRQPSPTCAPRTCRREREQVQELPRGHARHPSRNFPAPANLAGIVALSTTLQRQPSTRRKARELLEGNLPTLYDAINEELLAAVRKRPRERGCRGVRDRRSARSDPAEERSPPARSSWGGRGKLKELDCHVLTRRRSSTRSAARCRCWRNEYGELLGLPLIPVTATDDGVRRRAVASTKQIALERVTGCGSTESALFEDPPRSTSSSRSQVGTCARCSCSSARKSNVATSSRR
jgi:hypothetical protein